MSAIFYKGAMGAFVDSVEDSVPIRFRYNGGEFVFSHTGNDEWSCSDGGLEVKVIRRCDEKHDALIYRTEIKNISGSVVTGFDLTPIFIRMNTVVNGRPRVRTMEGCRHYDSTCPTRAFHLRDYTFMTHDHSRAVEIGGNCSREWSPVMQFAVSGETKSGFFVLPEWSASWTLKAGHEFDTFSGEPGNPFVVQGTMATLVDSVQPGETVVMPNVHLVFFDEKEWDEADNRLRRYLTDISARLNGRIHYPVSYDHWFGIYGRFDVNYLMEQAKRAAELGCEYFCLDAMWYKPCGDGLSTGNWDTPDPYKFPNGKADIKRLADYVRSLGMGFGIWHLLQICYEGSTAREKYPEAFDDILLALDREEGFNYALDTISSYVEDYGITWTRFESFAHDGLKYNRGYDRLIDTLRKKYPDLYIEICSGGGQRLDINSILRTDGNWLSDHTSSPEGCRLAQTGALRVWPAHFLNMAVTAFKGRASQTATLYEGISRMPGVLSFNGAISEWTDGETALMKQCVDAYKATRHLKDQPVFFPLGQPQSIDDWESVVVGDGSGEAQLLFVFRLEGKDYTSFTAPGSGKWEKLIESDKAELSQNGDCITVKMPQYCGAIWIRKH